MIFQLPIETQARVSSYIMNKAKLNQESPTGLSGKTNPTTPEKINPDEFEFNISASLMSKILEESVQNTISKHCDTCTCLKKSSNPFSYSQSHFTVSTQTLSPRPLSPGLCTKCNSTVELVFAKPFLDKSSVCPTPPLQKAQEAVAPGVYPPRSPEKDNLSRIVNADTNKSPIIKPCVVELKNIKPVDETVKLVSTKHKQIMDKIGENLNEMNLKNDFQIPAIEPISGHHRLCDRTKPVPTLSKAATEYFYGKPDENTKGVDPERSEPFVPSPKLVSTIRVADDVAVTFADIENPTLIPNLAECKNNCLPKSKADLNFMETANNFRNNSISSNEAESKTSSTSRSWKNNGSHNGSSNKVHIGPGPRFCSLRMQAGSKNILLDNAQPNIAPVLYTRQTRNPHTSPAEEDNPLPFLAYPQPFLGTSTISPIFSTTQEIAILDLPNEELPLTKPIDICEKPESGYKSNESAEIIDKLLFGVDPTLPVCAGAKTTDVSIEFKPQITIPVENDTKENNDTVSESKDKKTVVNRLEVTQNKNGSEKVEHFQRERRVSIHNMKVFNFDQYEKNLKVQPTGKVIRDNKISYGNTPRVPGTARQVINHMVKDQVAKVSPDDLNKLSEKTVDQITKKIVRNIANQTLPENLAGETLKDWKKETSTEKSSSSLSSDDSAAVLQKQQLIRVAQWVQQNLEMEHAGGAAAPPLEEMHHVRGDFPRPAKVEHSRRKKGRPAPPPQVSMVMGPCQLTTRSYSREELARMEHNVKQFLLNGSRWTPETAHEFPDPDAEQPASARRTSSKTETDL